MIQNKLFRKLTLVAILTSACGPAPKNFAPLKQDTLGDRPIEIEERQLQASIPGGVHGHTVNNDSEILYGDSFGNAAPIRFLYKLRPPYDQPRRVGVSGELPAGMEWYANHYYICDAGSGTVSQFTADFELVRQWYVPQPWNIAVSQGGKIVAVTTSGALYKLNSDGRAQRLFEGMQGSFDVVFHDENSVWITEQGLPNRPGRVRRYSLDGDVLNQLPGLWLNPEGLLMTTRKVLWVNDTEAGKIWRINLQTEDAQLVTDRYRLPIAVSQFPDGDVLVNAKENGYLMLRFQEDLLR